MAFCRGGSPTVRRALFSVALVLLDARYAGALELVRLSIARDVPAQLANRIDSSVRGQLGDVGTLVESAETCRVQIERDGDALTLRFADVEGRPLGQPRTISLASEELAASEAGTMVRAFVLARVGPLAVEPQASEPDAARPEQPAAQPQSEGMAKAEAKSTEDRPVAHFAPPLGGPELRASAFYSGESYAEQLRWRQGMRAELSLRIGRWLQLGASYLYEPPTQLRVNEFTIRIRDHRLGGMLGVGRDGARLGLAGDLLVELARTVRETVSSSAPFAGTNRAGRWGALLVVRVRGRVRIVSRWWLEVAPALELAVAQRAFAVASGATTSIVSPHVVRGRLDLGASFMFP